MDLKAMHLLRTLVTQPWTLPLPRDVNIAAMAAELYRAERQSLGSEAQLLRCVRHAAAMLR